MDMPDPRKQQDTPREWARILWLDREIRAGHYPTLQRLQEEFGIGRRTALKAVAFLRDSLDAPMHYSRHHRGYHYEDPTYALPTVFLREGELLALLLAEQVTRQYLGTPLEAPLRTAIEKIRRSLPEDVQVHLADVADTFFFAGASSVEVPLQRLIDLQRAIRERRVVHVLYHTMSRDDIRERDIEPHFLTNVRGDWMVIAWDRWRDEDRVFMLARMHEYQLLGELFSPRPELSPQVYSKHTFLTDHGQEPYEVVLRFDSHQARWIRERSWHATQRVEEHADGGLILRLTVSGEGDLTRWIMGYGRHVEVLEPAWLRAHVANECGRAASLYGEREHRAGECRFRRPPGATGSQQYGDE